MSYNQVFSAVEEHFDEALLDELSLTQRSFPSRVLPDLQLALDQLPDFGFTIRHFFAAQQGHLPVVQLAQIYDRNPMMPVLASAPEYLIQRQVEVYRDPIPDATQAFGSRYASRTILDPGDAVAPLALPSAAVAVADLLP